MSRDATANQVDELLEEVCEETAMLLTPQIVYSTDNYNNIVLQGSLVDPSALNIVLSYTCFSR